MKPVATGGRRCRVDSSWRWVSADAIQLAEAAGVSDRLSRINPLCFREPLAPWVAARRARRPVRVASLLRAFHEVRAQHAFVVVEGIGGLAVPLTSRATIGHLAQQLALPVIIVARPGLGTLNHTLLTLAEAHRLRLRVIAIFLNPTEPGSRHPMARLAVRTNPSALRAWSRVPVYGPLDYLKGDAVGRVSRLKSAAWIVKGVGEEFLNTLMRA